jgi:hypothetical protein
VARDNRIAAPAAVVDVLCRAPTICPPLDMVKLLGPVVSF